ncbi:MAG: hypothetical protein K6F52_05930, partial [Clostridia bacterium]|nr:hypothetical protein [Clostridia bacterium]
MKRNISLILTAVLIFAMVFAMAACGEKPAEEGTDGTPNPMTEYSSIYEINEMCGGALVKPEEGTLKAEKFFVIDCGDYKIAEYQFSLDGVPFKFRFSDTSEDISGVYDGDDTIFSSNDKEIVINDEVKAARWFNDGQYCLTTSDVANISDDAFNSLVESLKALSGLIDWSDTYAMLEGEWQDSYSQRCVMTLKNEGDHVGIKVHWGDSCASFVEWNMTATAGEDGTLNYSDCTKDYITMADNGDIVSSESQKIDKDGYFLYSAEKKTLSWEG